MIALKSVSMVIYILLIYLETYKNICYYAITPVIFSRKCRNKQRIFDKSKEENQAMQKEYQFLCEFSNGTRPTRTHLVHRYGEESVKTALGSGWIVELKNSNGDIAYEITSEGEARRDN